VPRWVNFVVSWNGLGGPIEWVAARDRRFVRNWKQAHAEAGPAEAPAPAAEEATR
jgi:hypothetical protein